MKKLNILLDKLDREFPRVTKKIDNYGAGKIVQVIMANKKDKTIKTKDDVKPGIYVSDKEEIKIVEILYTNIQEKKQYEKDLYDILIEDLKDNIIYVCCVSQAKDSLLIQFYIMREVKSIEI